MKKRFCRILSIVLCIVALLSVAVFTAACNKDSDGGDQTQTEQTAPQKLKDRNAISVTEGGTSASITVADYIKANGNEVSVSSSAPDKATATLSDGAVTVTPVSAGTATVTLKCGSIEITFEVTVAEKQITPPTQQYTVTLNGEETKVDKGGTFTLPETFTPQDGDFEFVQWNIAGEYTLNGNAVTVNGDLTITAETRRKAAVKIKDGNPLEFTENGAAQFVTVSEYITTHGNEVTVSSSAPDKATATLSDGVITVTPVSAGTATVTVECGSMEITFEVTVNAAQSTVPTAKKATVEIDGTYDLNSGVYTVNLADNIDNANLITSYTVDSQSVQGNEYTISGGDYTDTPKAVTLNVTAVYSGGNLTYTYKVNIKDTRAYRINNGDFNSGLDGWTKFGDIGDISSATAYWPSENGGEGCSFNANGKFFSAYTKLSSNKPTIATDGNEAAVGALISSPFKVAQNRIVTFKLGGAKHDIFIDVIEKDTGKIIARYGNSEWAENTNELKSGCTLIAYKAELPQDAAGKTVYIRAIDMASADYGVLFCDSFVTFYEDVPASGFVDAVDIADRPATVYEIYNGGFEKDMAGWITSGGEIGAVTSDKSYWNDGDREAVTDRAYGQEGSKLFSWWSWEGNKIGEENPGHEVNREGNMGTLTSNMFVLKNNKFVSFMLGGANRNVYVELVNAQSGTVMAVFRNGNAVNDKQGCLIRYHYLTNLTEETLCYFRVVDVAVSGWGCFTADGFKVNLDAAPENSALADNLLQDYKTVFNGSFENGFDGWTVPTDNDGCTLGFVIETEKAEDWYQTNESTKDGKNLFTFYNGNVNKEDNLGIIRSSAFVLQKNGIVSFRLGAALAPKVYINLYTADGKLLATFRNNAYTQNTLMVHYYYQCDNTEEISCYFEIVDEANVGEGIYRCVVMDDFRANLTEVPQGAVLGSGLTKDEREAQQQQQQ